MKRVVIDCSVVMAWCFEDEADKYSDSILDMLASAEALVPSIWALEVANVEVELKKLVNTLSLLILKSKC